MVMMFCGDDDDAVLDELVRAPELEVGPVPVPVPDAVSKIVSPSVSVVPSPTPTTLSPAVPSQQQLSGL